MSLNHRAGIITIGGGNSIEIAGLPKTTMWQRIGSLKNTLVTKLILTVGVTLLFSISGLSYFLIKYQEKIILENMSEEADRLINTVRLGTHYAMMLNSRDDIANIILNISKQPEITSLRIYNKEGRITYTHHAGEEGNYTNIKDEACFVCHRTEPPQVALALKDRTRVFMSPEKFRQIGILSPIYNESSCAADPCHVHPSDKKVLGAIDLVMSLKQADRELFLYKERTLELALLIFLFTSLAIFVVMILFVRNPLQKLEHGALTLAKGEHFTKVEVEQDDEVGRLATAFNMMAREIEEKQAELNRQRDEYQRLFELVPCLITVQDRDYRLINFNREFAQLFGARSGDFCYKIYKGRTEKCEDCPVEKTFVDGKSHQSEQSGFRKDGSRSHWIVRTNPITDARGRVVAAMEMNLDITDRKMLEEELYKSENNYHAIFNNIPNPVFVLQKDTLDILDCNQSMSSVYGYRKFDIIGRNFMRLFPEEDRRTQEMKLRTIDIIEKATHIGANDRRIFVNIKISPSHYSNREVLLVTTNDITKRLEAEQQLHQAGKLATLGEMATGVAHELNQPLSVIKTVSSYFMKKIRKDEPIDTDTLRTMLGKVDSNVDRATNIITHMRIFARKSEVKLEPVQVNEIMDRALDIFNQQLKVRGIAVRRDFQEDLPEIMADPNRLEQVFINLLINARDAMEKAGADPDALKNDKVITLRSRLEDSSVMVEVEDTGPGVPEDVATKIFDPFFTTKEVGEGTGLGLSISYGIVKDCGGIIRLKPPNGEGACFILEFPTRKDGDGKYHPFGG